MLLVVSHTQKLQNCSNSAFFIHQRQQLANWPLPDSVTGDKNMEFHN